MNLASAPIPGAEQRVLTAGASNTQHPGDGMRVGVKDALASGIRMTEHNPLLRTQELLAT